MKQLTLLSVTTALFAPATTFSAQPKESPRPNIIIILADDLGYGDVSAYGAQTLSTPNIDRLANGGIRFTRGYATSSTSTPSRYALMTGEYPWRNPRARILAGDAPLIISETQPTLPKMMQQAGYRTGAIGKWHLGMGNGQVDWNGPISPDVNSVGFDYSCVIAATQDRVPTVYIENGRVVGLEDSDPLYVNYHTNFEGEPTGADNPELLKMMWSHGHAQSIHNGISRIGYQKGGTKARWQDETMADYFVEKVSEFLDSDSTQPFFLYYGLHQPHVPRTPNPRFVGTSGMGPRGDAIVEADWCVGQLLRKLEEKGVMDNTLIFFSSDNGPVIDDGYQDQAVELLGDHTPAGSLRGGKYSLFEGGTRIPLITYWKGHISPQVSDAMVCQMDIFQSLASLLGIKRTTGPDSQDMLAEFLGQSNRGRHELIIESIRRLAYREDDWVLIPPYKGNLRNESGNETGNMKEFGLYHLTTDLGQQQNLAQKYPEKLEQMKTRFKQLAGEYYESVEMKLK